MPGQAVGEANVAPTCPTLGALGTWLSDWIVGKGWNGFARFLHDQNPGLRPPPTPECLLWSASQLIPRIKPRPAAASCGQLRSAANCQGQPLVAIQSLKLNDDRLIGACVAA